MGELSGIRRQLFGVCAGRYASGHSNRRTGRQAGRKTDSLSTGKQAGWGHEKQSINQFTFPVFSQYNRGSCQERQGSDEQAAMETDKHDAMFCKLHVLVQKFDQVVKHMIHICH